jgi:hypothetical protein
MFVRIPKDTFWIQCFVRDVKGGEDSEIISFIVNHNFASATTVTKPGGI